MTGENNFRRAVENKLFTGVIVLMSVSVTVPLFMILLHVLKAGMGALSWDFFVNLPKPVGETGGGIINAVVGTVMLVFIAGMISLPLGITAGLFLSEFKDSRLAYGVRLGSDVIQGIPSIVIGIVAYMWIVVPMNGFSALSGGIALAIMMLPVVIKSTEETLNLLPASLKEASLALGVPYHRTVLTVVLPAGFSGISTGILLAVSRITGETAPLLFTAFGNPFMNFNIFKPVSSLPLIIYTYAVSPYPDWHALAWSASLVLIAAVFVFNLVSKFIAGKWKIGF